MKPIRSLIREVHRPSLWRVVGMQRIDRLQALLSSAAGNRVPYGVMLARVVAFTPPR